jgi:hypothetical protein
LWNLARSAPPEVGQTILAGHFLLSHRNFPGTAHTVSHFQHVLERNVFEVSDPDGFAFTAAMHGLILLTRGIYLASTIVKISRMSHSSQEPNGLVRCLSRTYPVKSAR